MLDRKHFVLVLKGMSPERTFLRWRSAMKDFDM
jgi:hypothetical protein